MSEAVYVQVEDAIRRRLCLAGRYLTPIGGASFEYPVAIREGNIILRDCDCGLAKPERVITTDEWARHAEGGLYRRVGMWDFAPAEDPAADDIAWCHRDPDGAGRVLHDIRQERDAALAELRSLRSAITTDLAVARAHEAR